ncbi:MAG TPA: pyridoxal-phosphate dependent enzyme [Ktedonobacteraceae bacterium]|jgi:threonine dehydratase
MNEEQFVTSTSDNIALHLSDIRDAAARIKSFIHRTPVLTSRTLNQLVGAQVFLKAECYQRAGAFKIRGALNKVLQLSAEERARGLFAWSSGNHAQAVALAAQIVGTTATILMPQDAPEAKVLAVRGYGAEIITYDRYSEDREALARQLVRERNAVSVPPYDDFSIMAGQGTVALELIEEVQNLDVLLVPTSGGGLIAGCATVVTSLNPKCRVYGVEPVNGNDTKQSLDAKTRIRIPVPHTIADGLQVELPGELTFAINRRLLTDILLVTDDEILAAMVLLFERLKVVAEPSGASAFAALLASKVDVANLRVGVVISGGNVGVQRFCALLAGKS